MRYDVIAGIIRTVMFILVIFKFPVKFSVIQFEFVLIKVRLKQSRYDVGMIYHISENYAIINIFTPLRINLFQYTIKYICIGF